MTPVLIGLFGSRHGLVRLRHDLQHPQGRVHAALDAGRFAADGRAHTVRWLGSTAVEMNMVKAKPPFESAGLVIFMERATCPGFGALPARRVAATRSSSALSCAHRPMPTLKHWIAKAGQARDGLRRIESERWTVSEPTADEALAIYFRPRAHSSALAFYSSWLARRDSSCGDYRSGTANPTCKCTWPFPPL